MRAVWYERAGPADEVLISGEMPTPDPAPGEVLVRVHASGINPSDVKLRAGGRPGTDGIGFPRIVPHSDGAGVIEAVGDGVDPARTGERVWLWNAQWQRAFGTCAEYIALPAAQAVPLPDGASFETGASLGIPATTGCATVLGDGPVAGKTILITGGAGTVSLYAIQIAVREGARVLTTISTEEKAQVARNAGADATIDYRAGNVAEAVLDLTGGDGIDMAVDLEFGSNVDAVVAAMKPSGLIVAYGSANVKEPVLPFYPLMFKRITLRTELVYLLPDAERARVNAFLTNALKEGWLDCRIGACLKFSEVFEAHGLVERSGVIGGVVLRP